MGAVQKMTGNDETTVPVKATRDQQRPNIIFFVADDMTPEMFNFLPAGKGRNLTPALDRLAKEGMVMKNQHVVSPVCTPSRYNVLTGRYASRATNGEFLEFTKSQEGQTVVQWATFITPNDVTLAKKLKDSGYTTGFVGKNHVVQVSDLYRFPSYDEDPRTPKNKRHLRENYEKVTSAINKTGFDFAARIYHNNPNWIGLKELAVQNLDWIAQGGVQFIEENREQPFFLYFATTVPHGPTEAPRSWNADPHITPLGILDVAPNVLPPRETIPKRLKEAGIIADNKENVLWLDDALSVLVKTLEKNGLDDNTIIFFFNDHGQNAKGTVYQGGVHNPSVVWRKGGFEGGASSDVLVSNIDFMPTILELAGYKGDLSFADGVSFAPVLNGSRESNRDSLYFELGYARGVRKGHWKFISVRYPPYAQNMTKADRKRVLDEYNQDRIFRQMPLVTEDPSAPFSHLSAIPGGGDAELKSTGVLPGYYAPDQLYNLAEDPGEHKNLATDPAYEKVLTEMKEALQTYLDDLPGQYAL